MLEHDEVGRRHPRDDIMSYRLISEGNRDKDEVRASQLTQASERVGSLIPASQQG